MATSGNLYFLQVTGFFSEARSGACQTSLGFNRDGPGSLLPHLIVQSHHRALVIQILGTEKNTPTPHGGVAKSHCTETCRMTDMCVAILGKRDLPHTYSLSDEATQTPPDVKRKTRAGQFNGKHVGLFSRRLLSSPSHISNKIISKRFSIKQVSNAIC